MVLLLLHWILWSPLGSSRIGLSVDSWNDNDQGMKWACLGKRFSVRHRHHWLVSSLSSPSLGPLFLNKWDFGCPVLFAVTKVFYFLCAFYLSSYSSFEEWAWRGKGHHTLFAHRHWSMMLWQFCWKDSSSKCRCGCLHDVHLSLHWHRVVLEEEEDTVKDECECVRLVKVTVRRPTSLAPNWSFTKAVCRCDTSTQNKH